MNRRTLLAGTAVGCLSALVTESALASNQWCESDPAVPVVVDGTEYTVEVTLRCQDKPGRLALLQKAGIVPVVEGGFVALSILVPTDGQPFKVDAIASSQPNGAGVVY